MNYKTGIAASPLSKQESFRSKNKDWFAMSQDNVSEGATYHLRTIAAAS